MDFQIIEWTKQDIIYNQDEDEFESVEESESDDDSSNSEKPKKIKKKNVFLLLKFMVEHKRAKQFLNVWFSTTFLY